jgi:CHAT domain-containing protein/Tfp pilus assembly protein PilF
MSTAASPCREAWRTVPGRRRQAAAAACWFAGGAFILALPVSPVAQPPASANLRPARPARPVLTVGKPVECALAAGESRSFDADLAAGGTYAVAVEQRGIDVVVEVRAPQGERLAAVDGPLERWGTELVLLRPVVAGTHRVEVRGEKKGVGAGRFKIRLDDLPASTQAERARIDALQAATRGGELLFHPAPGSLEPARAAFAEARDRFLAAGDPTGAAEATNAVAAVLHRLGRLRQAAELYREAASRWRDLGLDGRQARAWNDLGLTSWEVGDLAAADDALARGLALAQALGDAYDEADLRNDQCLVLHARGGIRAALDCYRDALARFRQLGEARDQASVLNNLGFAYYSLGEPQPAEENYEQALAIQRATGDRHGEAQDLNNLAVLHRSLGEVATALRYYGEARAILATLDDRREEAAALNNLGVAYAALGEAERARLDFTRALDLRRAAEDRRGEVSTLNNLGRLEQESGNLEAAAAFYRQALSLARAASDPGAEAVALSSLGEVDAAAGRAGVALDELDQALAGQARIGDHYHEATTLRRKAEVLAASGRGAEALPLFDRSLAFCRSIGNRVDEARTLTARARAWRDTGRLDAARGDAEAAIAAVESLRTQLRSPELRSSFFGYARDAYDLEIDLLVRLDGEAPGQGFDRAAFEASERARARTLLDVLRDSGSAALDVGDPAQRARRRDLERRLALKADRRQSQLGGGDPARLASLQVEIEQVMADLDSLDAEMRRQDPRYAGLTRPAGSSTTEIQALLGPDTLLLEYHLGRERSFLWVAGETSLRTVVLSGRGEIESAARAFHERVSAPPAAGEQDRGRLGEALSRLLLAPAAAALGDHRLAIVADGALQYVPFAALPEPGAAAGGARQPGPLLRRHEIVELPSASVLAVQRRELARRAPAARLAIVFADPVFDGADSRVARAGGGAAVSGAGRPAAAPAGISRGGELDRFGRLRFSRREAQAIAALGPPGAVATELDFAANREAVLSGRLRDYRYVHFATHGTFDSMRPELSALVLSRVGPDGEPREGFLRLRDIYGLDLNADLVVLSGCRTALGKEIRGEGLLGLTRGFLYAGAARVVASLWWVDDRATAELMTRFYRGLWSGGLPPAAALRQARLAIAAERRFRDPYYWGAFLLQGDWR